MAGDWVDFKAVKQAVSIRQVLDHYGIDWLRKSGHELRGRCPIHKGDGPDAFHVSVEKNCFQCFSCKARGNVLDLVAAMESCTVRDAAVRLAEWFSVPGNGSAPRPERQTKNPPAQTAPAASGGVGTVSNVPLTFQLRGIDPSHPYVASRGIRQQTAELFGIGVFSGRGSMAGRCVIPIHNERGELVAYAGRSIDGSEPKYKLPAGFHKAAVLYNLHRSVTDNDPRMVVVVEGFFDCLRVYEAGYPCVALIGCSISEQQAELLASNFSAVWLLLDGDDAGRGAAIEIAGRLLRRMFIKVVDAPARKQPDELSSDELRSLLK